MENLSAVAFKHLVRSHLITCFAYWLQLYFFIYDVCLTEIPRNGGDDKSKNVERNPSNILPGNYIFLTGTNLECRNHWHSVSFRLHQMCTGRSIFSVSTAHFFTKIYLVFIFLKVTSTFRGTPTCQKSMLSSTCVWMTTSVQGTSRRGTRLSWAWETSWRSAAHMTSPLSLSPCCWSTTCQRYGLLGVLSTLKCSLIPILSSFTLKHHTKYTNVVI